jgi:hypothetical protein
MLLEGIALTPQPAGFRYYRTHVCAHAWTYGAGDWATKASLAIGLLGGDQEAEADLTASNPGLTLFHCRQQFYLWTTVSLAWLITSDCGTSRS